MRHEGESRVWMSTIWLVIFRRIIGKRGQRQCLDRIMRCVEAAEQRAEKLGVDAIEYMEVVCGARDEAAKPPGG